MVCGTAFGSLRESRHVLVACQFRFDEGRKQTFHADYFAADWKKVMAGMGA
jgi:hypothetical protein